MNLDKRFSQVVIWGHPLHSNTFSYINEAFYRAFAHLGYETYWLQPKHESIKDALVPPDSLFFTEGQVDHDIPIRDDCWYIIHNCDGSKYPPERTLTLQVYTDDVLGRDVEKLNEWSYWQPEGRVLYMPWATDLLPHEIGELAPADEDVIHWVGTIGAGRFGNVEQIEGIRRACTRLGWRFVQHTGVSRAQHRELIRHSRLAPAVTGTWQTENNYVPCRVFKNISYGQWPVTNNAKVFAIFDFPGGAPIYHEDPEELVYSAKVQTANMGRLSVVQFVKEHHTYINRIQTILEHL